MPASQMNFFFFLLAFFVAEDEKAETLFLDIVRIKRHTAAQVQMELGFLPLKLFDITN